MNRDEIIRTAVGAVRAPFAVADMQIVRFRGERSRARMVPQTALGLLDTLAERIAPVSDHAPAESATAHPTQPSRERPAQQRPAQKPAEEAATDAAPQDGGPAQTAAQHDDAPLEDEHREEQLAAERTARERKATRANKSLSSIAQDLAVAEAVADAHEQRAREDELDAKDFGPKG